ncbi:carboxypeptidase-like regulatory domain-containing protein [Amycolatopsis sp. WGS_07]|uniref:carboxypeptidase-like regulatory domain-containing protein n=1 Tax=Amycolatopsis sp. WGS_07 TaxID=3076764 RepID=UPI0038735EB3
MDDAGETPPIEQGHRTRAAILLPPRRPATSAGKVSGRVRRADGAAVGGAELTLVDAEGNQVDVTRSRDDGTYALRTASDGRYLLTCANPPGQPSAEFITVLAGRLRHNVVLTGDVGLSGAVGGAPVPASAAAPRFGFTGRLSDNTGASPVTAGERTATDLSLAGTRHLPGQPRVVGEKPVAAKAGEHTAAPSGRVGVPPLPDPRQGPECR